ncbi:MAG: hypothetical protein L0Z62_21385 [Gemmataceae bacterium]|nr:hypothetical protein [Gemmataceae bacterium]
MICGIIMLIFGILTLVQGKFMLTRTRVVQGPPAYVIGAMLIAPLPLSFLAGMLLGALFLVAGDPASERRFQTLATVVGLGIPVACLLSAVGIGIAYAKPAPKRVFRPGRDDDEGLRPPRRDRRDARGYEDRGDDDRSPRHPPDDRIR